MLFHQLSDKLDQFFKYSIREHINDFFDRNYDKNIANFIKMVLFNKKENDIYKFYNKTISLGIVWMIAISGFHLQILVMILRFIFKKIKIMKIIIPMLFILFYLYLLNFSYSSLRVFFTFLITTFFKKNKFSKFNQLGMVGLFIIFTNSAALTDYGFALSFISCIGLYYVLSLEFNNILLEKILINFCICILTLPIIVQMNKGISLFIVLNSFVFSYFFIFIYIYFLFFAWFPFLQIAHQGIIYGIYFLISSFDNLNLVFQFNKIHNLIWFAYYYLIIFFGELINFKVNKL